MDSKATFGTSRPVVCGRTQIPGNSCVHWHTRVPGYSAYASLPRLAGHGFPVRVRVTVGLPVCHRARAGA
eukprot:2069852-Rhodomonas_salina.2